MGWLYSFISRSELIKDLTQPAEHVIPPGDRRWAVPFPVVRALTCEAHCYRGNAHSGVLWAVFTINVTTLDKQHRVAPPYKFITCFFMNYCRGQWGYKDVDELAGPCSWSCPLGYLAMVPPDRYDVCPSWRRGVRAYHAESLRRRRLKREQRAARRI